MKKKIGKQLNKAINIQFNWNKTLTENKKKKNDSYYPYTVGQDIAEKYSRWSPSDYYAPITPITSHDKSARNLYLDYL